MRLDGQFLTLFTLMCIFWEGNYQTAEQQTASDGAASNIARSLESYSTRRRLLSRSPRSPRCGTSSSEPNGALGITWGDLLSTAEVCEWFITAPVNYRVVLSAQMYDIDRCDGCQHNYLEIRDGTDASSHLKGKYCGTKFPPGTTSSSNGIYLKFVTDGTKTYVGFVITWSIALAVPDPPLPEIAKLEVTKSTISIVWHINRTVNMYDINSIRTTCNFVSTDGRGFEKVNQQSENDLTGYGSSPNITIKTTVNGLSPFSKYNCIAAILNNAGYGPNSTVVTTRTSEDVPGAPTHLNVSYVAGADAILHWGAPDYVAGTLAGYEILVAYKLRFLKPTSCSATGGQTTFSIEASARQKVFFVPYRYTDYTFSVRAKTNAGWGSYSDSVSILTAPGAPGAVTSFKYSNTPNAKDPNVLDAVLSWQLPCKLNGEIESFHIRFHGMKGSFENHTGSLEYNVSGIITADQIFRKNLEELKGEYNYTFEIAAKVAAVSAHGSPVTCNAIYPAGIPPPPEKSYMKKIRARQENTERTSSTAEVVLPLFGNTNGDIKYYAIMVSEIGQNLAAESRFDISSGIWPNVTSWREAMSGTPIVTYQATPMRWIPGTTRDVVTYENLTAVRFVLGKNDSCSKLSTASYCNVPLRPDTRYQVRMRAFTNGGYRDSEAIIVKTVPAAVSDLTAPIEQISWDSVDITWAAPSSNPDSIMSYRVEMCQKNTCVVDNTTDQFYNATGLSPCLTYTFAVSAVSDAGVSVATRIPVNTSYTVIDPPVPEISEPEVTKSTISIKWSIDRTMNMCELKTIRTVCDFVSTDGEGFELVDRYSEDDLTAFGSDANITIKTTVSDLSPFSWYNCTAATENIAGYSANSTIVPARTAEDAPSAPFINVSAIGSSNFTLQWDPPSYLAGNLTEYEILLSWKPLFLVPSSCVYNEPSKNITDITGSELEYIHLEAIAYANYTASIKAKTNAGWGNYSDCIRFQTNPDVPEAVTNVTYWTTTNSNDSNILDTFLSWNLPCSSNGEIESFRLRFNGTRAGFENHTYSRVYNDSEIITADQIFRENLGELRGEHSYNFEIAAKVVGVSAHGHPSNYNVIYPAGLPPWPEPSYANAIAADRTYKDKNTLTTTWVVLPLFKNTNGDIKYYAIMVSEIGNNFHAESRFNISSGNWPPETSWKKANSNTTTDTYQATPNWWYPNTTQDIMNVGGHKAVKFMLGKDNSCRNSAATSHCNGPLKPGTWYQVRMRAFTNGGYRDSGDVIVQTKLEVKHSTQDEVKALDVKLIPKKNHLFDVDLTWEKPPSPPTHYTVIIIVVNGSGISHETSQNFSGSATEALVSDVKITGHFTLNVKPWPKKSVWRQDIVISTSVVGTILVITGVGIAVYKYSKIRIQRRQAQVDEYEMSPSSLVITRVLGTGAFGIVKLGRMRDDQGHRIDVAVKMLRDDSNKEHTHNFHLEIKMMKALDKHPNIVSMLGCCTIGPYPFLVLEYCARGDLHSFLCKALVEETLPVEEIQKRAIMKRKLPRRKDIDVQENSKPTSTSASSEDYVEVSMLDADQDNDSDPDILTPMDMLNFGRQIATGMEFLSSNRIVHRDLATRNILVCHNQTVKISDFGLSRDVYQENIYQKSGLGRMPLKWMAIESLTHQIYSTYSDVWSFGVLLWEITTLGGDPYPGVPTIQILNRLQSGYRMEQPVNCSDSLYKVMLSCWQAKPKDRPVFAVLRQELDNLISLDAENQYYDLNGAPEEMLIEVDTKAPEQLDQAEDQL